MKPALKILLIVLGVLLGGVVAAAVFLPFYFDPNDYKEQIAAALERQTGREVAIPGDIKLTVFPWLGMELGEASLGNAPGFGSEAFAKVKSANIGVRLMPLLRKQIQVGTVRVDGLMLNLARNAQGKGNWEDIGPRDQPKDKSAEEKAKRQEFKMQSLEVAAVDISNAALLWSDAQSGSRYRLDKFNFKSGELRSGKPFDLDSSFVLADLKSGSATEVELNGKVKGDVASKTYQVQGLKVDATTTGKSVPGGKQKLRLTGNMALSLVKEQLRIENLVLSAAGIELKGEANGSRILSDALYSGQLSSSVNPRDIYKALGKPEPTPSDDKVLRKASFNTQFSSTTRQLTLKQLQMKLDDTTLTGTATVANFSDPQVGFALKVDAIDLDRYLPPDQKGKKNEAGPPGAATKIPVDAVRPLNLNGTLDIGRLKMKNLRFDNARVVLRSRNGVMTVEPLTANFYDGQINMTSRIDATGSRPAYGVNATVSGVQAQRMLKDMMGKGSVDGVGSVNVNVSSSGDTAEEIKRTLNGTVAFNFRDGHVNGFNLQQKIRQANALRTGQRLSDDDAPQKTEFSTVAGTLRIVNGVIQNDDLDGRSPSLHAGGRGNANLVAESIDYLAKVRLLDTDQSLGSKELDKLKNLEIPIRITGSLFKPKWQVDLGSVLKEHLQGELEKQQDKLKSKAEDRLKGALGIGGGASGADAAGGAEAGATGSATTGESSAEPKSAEDPIKELFGGGEKKKKKKKQQEAAPAEAAPAAPPPPAEAAPSEATTPTPPAPPPAETPAQ